MFVTREPMVISHPARYILIKPSSMKNIVKPSPMLAQLISLISQRKFLELFVIMYKRALEAAATRYVTIRDTNISAFLGVDFEHT